MKAVVINDFGDTGKLVYTDVEKPNVGEGEVLVRIKAAGVNPVDAKIREGYLKTRMPHTLPAILGWDMAGVVVDTGHSASRFVPGDEVYAYARRPEMGHGTYAEYISLPESYLSYKPSNLTFEEAAAVPLAGLTAYQALFEKGKLGKNNTLLVIGASGGVGSFAVQFGKVMNAKVYAVAGANREAYLKGLGADYVLDYQSGDWVTRFRELLPEGAGLVFDCLGKDGTLKGYECTKKEGTLVSILTQPDKAWMEKYNITHKYLFVEPNVRHLDQIRDWIEKKKVRVNLQEVLDLKDVAKAHTMIDTGHTQGKIVLKIS